ncbi:uncharacterized protein [Apostichopus japonicus]|uniref:uncharacterized protein isoform X1 n=1 Tax=Stichopus japonicus TaxID=307972 RepID=UPI003AB65E36
MKKTYGNRMLWITNESPTLAEILQKYPRYIDVEGLVNQDLQMKFGDEVSRQLLMKWDSSIAPVILKLAEQTSTTAIRELFMEFNENKDSSSYDRDSTGEIPDPRQAEQATISPLFGHKECPYPVLHHWRSASNKMRR